MSTISPTNSLTIRWATAGDGPELARLAALDSSDVPTGRLLLAEVAGAIKAAVPASGGSAIADPFHPTTDLVALLEMRVRHLRRRDERAERRGLSPRPRLLLRTLRA
jgi:hypothetical protein